jgi:glucan endo-1,3-alpha-glucosidase
MAPPGGSICIGALWYKTTLKSTKCSTFNLVGSSNTQLAKPDNFGAGTDTLNWALVLAAGTTGYSVRTISNGRILDTQSIKPGLNYGSNVGVEAGAQSMQILDASGKVVLAADAGRNVSSGCPDGIYNMNYVV